MLTTLLIILYVLLGIIVSLVMTKYLNETNETPEPNKCVGGGFIIMALIWPLIVVFALLYLGSEFIGEWLNYKFPNGS